MTGLLMRILLVEDHPDTAEVLSKLLRTKGHEVETANTGRDALAACEGKGFDVLLCDIGLPDLDGWDLVSQVRGRCVRKAIAVTGYGQSADVDRSMQAGFDAHLTKPVDLPSLLRAIDEVMAA